MLTTGSVHEKLAKRVTYIFLAESAFEGEIATVDWLRKVHRISVRHHEVYFDFNLFVFVEDWFFPQRLGVSSRVDFGTVRVLDLNLALVALANRRADFLA